MTHFCGSTGSAAPWRHSKEGKTSLRKYNSEEDSGCITAGLWENLLTTENHSTQHMWSLCSKVLDQSPSTSSTARICALGKTQAYHSPLALKCLLEEVQGFQESLLFVLTQWEVPALLILIKPLLKRAFNLEHISFTNQSCLTQEPESH